METTSTSTHLQFYQSAISNCQFPFFATFTANHYYNRDQIGRLFPSFIQLIASRSRQKATIAYVAGFEESILWHVHAAILSDVALSPEMLQGSWQRLIGDAKVQPYNFNQNGISYIIKDCDVEVSDNFYLFLPDYVGKNSRERRLIQRRQERLV